MQRIQVSDLVVGQEYFVECGIWSGGVIYTHSVKKGNRIYYNFTFGSADNWLNQFNIFACKSRLKIFI